MFVRIKKIKGRPYAYLVKNEWTPWGSRQRVAKYLGRAHLLERQTDDETALPSGIRDSILVAVEQELRNHGFRTEGGCLTKGDIVVNLEKHTVRQRKKSVTLGMNEGFLCDHTLQQLLTFEPQERDDKTAKELATFVLEAGLKLSQEQFVHLFEQVNTFKNKKEDTKQP